MNNRVYNGNSVAVNRNYFIAVLRGSFKILLLELNRFFNLTCRPLPDIAKSQITFTRAGT